MNGNKYELSQEQVNRILAQANKIKFNDLLPALIFNILFIEAQYMGTSVEFILCPLLATLGLLLHHSTVQPFERSRQGICNFTALIAHPSTGKTPALNLVKSAMVKLEAFYQTPPEKSCLTNSASVEGLLEHLNSIACMLAYYDESNTFLGTIGRYSNGGGSALYERSIYLTLYAAVDFLDRDIKFKRTKILRPRFHMCLLGHPFYFINLLKLERFSYDDGLFQRFLMNAPRPPMITANEMRQTPNSIMTLHCIFLFVHMVHFERKRNYTFTNESLILIDSEFDKNRQRVQIANEFDSFLGALIGKTITQMLRIAMMLQALNVACNTLKTCKGVADPEITEEFARECQNKVNNLTADAFIIDIEITNRAKQIVDYFNLSKLVLSSYNVEPTGTFDDAFTKICEARPKQTFVSTRLATVPAKILRYMRKAMTTDLQIFNASLLSKGNLSKAEADIVFDNLEHMHLGTSKVIQSNNMHKVRYFYRVSSGQIQSNPTIGESIQDLGLNLQSVIENIQENDNNDQILPTNNSRRARTDDLREGHQKSPPSKRARQTTKLVQGQVKIRNDNQLPYVLKSNHVSSTSQASSSNNNSSSGITSNESSIYSFRDSPKARTNLSPKQSTKLLNSSTPSDLQNSLESEKQTPIQQLQSARIQLNTQSDTSETESDIDQQSAPDSSKSSSSFLSSKSQLSNHQQSINEAETVVIPKKKRGRPPKAANKLVSYDSESEQQLTSNSITSTASNSGSKIQNNSNQIVCNDSLKKKRGRPPKAATKSKTKLKETMNVSSSSDSESEHEQKLAPNSSTSYKSMPNNNLQASESQKKRGRQPTNSKHSKRTRSSSRESEPPSSQVNQLNQISDQIVQRQKTSTRTKGYNPATSIELNTQPKNKHNDSKNTFYL